ncbi:MAG: hypothetical protein JWP03_5430 [Phycisphaerales bacterium]|jgi:hypothetical protein|nr:hypothetical protein [Phycisphaerales bacterium]
MLRQRKTAAPSGIGNETAAEETILAFDGPAIVRGITYHVIDEGMAGGISEEAARRTLERLQARSIRPTIERSRWGGLSNGERLEWLLAQSQTFLLIGPGNLMLLRSRRGH